jgi:hypothetical protein
MPSALRRTCRAKQHLEGILEPAQQEFPFECAFAIHPDFPHLQCFSTSEKLFPTSVQRRVDEEDPHIPDIGYSMQKTWK